MQFLFLFLLLSDWSLSQGIQFERGTFKEISDKAASEDKLIFMDLYTTWCGPCKRLDRDVFSDGQVGEFFNKHFINYKVDAEKGEGIAIASKYRVGAYPTLLFLQANGEIALRLTGYRPGEPLVDEAQTVLDPSHKPVLAERYKNDKVYRQQLEVERKKRMAFQHLLNQNKEFANLHREYENGNRDPLMIQDYILFREKLNIRDQSVLNEYDQLKQIKEAQNLKHVAIQSLHLEYAFDPLFDEMLQIIKDEGEVEWDQELGQVIDKSLSNSINQSLSTAIANRDSSALKALLQKQQKIMISKGVDSIEQTDHLSQMTLDFYAAALLKESYISNLKDFVKILVLRSHEFDSSMVMERKNLAKKINRAIEPLPRLSDDKTILREGLPWAEKSIELYPHPDMYAPYIQMLFLLKENNLANEAMKEGMIMGKREKLSTDKLFKAFSSVRSRLKKQQKS